MMILRLLAHLFVVPLTRTGGPAGIQCRALTLAALAAVFQTLAIAVVFFTGATPAGATTYWTDSSCLQGVSIREGSSPIVTPCDRTVSLLVNVDPDVIVFTHQVTLAIAGEGYLGASAHVGTNAGGSAGASAGFTGLNILLSGTGTVPDMTSMTLHLDGDISLLGGYVAISGSANGSPFDGSYNVIDGVHTKTGLLAAPPLLPTDVTITIPVSIVGANVTFIGGEAFYNVSVDLGLAVGAFCDDFTIDDPCSATTDYANTFGFTRTGPVFDLPAGWTANSEDGSIVNNVFVAVPEPSTWTLIGSPLIAIAVRRRAARARRRQT